MVWVHWPANPTIRWVVDRMSPDIVGKQGGLILYYTNGRAEDEYQGKLAAEAAYAELMLKPETCLVCRGKCWETGFCPDDRL